MKISILLPFRNAAPWIQETIESIQQQTFKEWELIAVNDHSTDTTESLIQAYNDTRIRVLRNNGEGIIPALQTALKSASGTFITRMDADDLMPRRKLELLWNNTEEGRVLLTGKVRYFSSKFVSEGYQNYQNWLNERCDLNDHFDHIYRECVVASPNWLAPKKYLLEDQLFEQLDYPEDYDMTFHWKEKGYRIKAVDEITHLWREHPNRTSRNSDTYDQASFFRLKLAWFRRLEKGKTLGVFGTGPKGKLAVQHLEKHFEIHWFDHEFENYSGGVNGYEIKDPEHCQCDLVLLAVYPKNKTRLENLVTRLDYKFGKTVWYV